MRDAIKEKERMNEIRKKRKDKSELFPDFSNESEVQDISFEG